MATYKITQVVSKNGATKRQIANLRSLGIRRMHQTVEVGLQHVNNVETVVVVVWCHLFLVVLKIFLYILKESETHV